ncbi:MAG: hypothetical protein J6U97_06875 [Bacteroidaceae bacterium]|nr:hypothetical protein [Bacteroidaceae bacterium]
MNIDMGKLTTKANNAFLLGGIIMMVMVLLIVVIFVFWALRLDRKMNLGQTYHEKYEFVLDESTLNQPLQMYVNDSLIFSGTPSTVFTLNVDRFATESTLLVVDTESDMVSLIELSEEGEKLIISKQGTEFTGTNP